MVSLDAILKSITENGKLDKLGGGGWIGNLQKNANAAALLESKNSKAGKCFRQCPS